LDWEREIKERYIREMEKKVCSNIKHGHSANGKVSPTYQSWRDMKRRSQNPNHKYYNYYGGRGIKVCKRWQNFANFLEDMGERPENTTLDRIDNGGNYEPGNCRWATPKQQVQNRREVKDQKHQYFFISMNEQGIMIASNNQLEFARQYGLNQGCISNCLNGRQKSHKGWRFKRITSLPGESLRWE